MAFDSIKLLQWFYKVMPFGAIGIKELNYFTAVNLVCDIDDFISPNLKQSHRVSVFLVIWQTCLFIDNLSDKANFER